jgi:hypothetical protein
MIFCVDESSHHIYQPKTKRIVSLINVITDNTTYEKSEGHKQKTEFIQQFFCSAQHHGGGWEQERESAAFLALQCAERQKKKRKKEAKKTARELYVAAS